MLTNWDGLAPAVAGVSLVVLALLPPSPDGAAQRDIRILRQQALESGAPGTAVTWNDPKSGLSGTLVPADVYRTAEGRLCRSYTVSVSGGGSSVHSACRLDIGTWEGDEKGAGPDSTLARLFGDPIPQLATMPEQESPPQESY